jgi:hypothetical protein
MVDMAPKEFKLEHVYRASPDALNHPLTRPEDLEFLRQLGTQQADAAFFDGREEAVQALRRFSEAYGRIGVEIFAATLYKRAGGEYKQADVFSGSDLGVILRPPAGDC